MTWDNVRNRRDDTPEAKGNQVNQKPDRRSSSGVTRRNAVLLHPCHARWSAFCVLGYHGRPGRIAA